MLDKRYFNLMRVIFLFVSVLVTPFNIKAQEPGKETAKETPVAEVKSEKAAKLVMEEQTFDFGEMLQQNKREHVFKIKNQGSANLIINDIKTSCGCTAAMASSSNIEPGGSGELRVIFSSKRFQGEVQRQISFASNDPDNKITTLKIKAFVKAILETKPSYISFGKVIGTRLSEKSLKVENMTNVPITLENIVSSDKHITIGDYTKILNPNESTDIIFKYLSDDKGSDNPKGIFGNIEVTIKGQSEKMLIPFSGQLAGEIQLLPKNVGFNVVKKDKDVKRKISIKNFGDKEFKLIKMEYDNKIINTDFKTPYTVKPGETVKITLEPSPDLQEGSFRSEVKFYTDNKEYQELLANVYGIVKDEKKEEP